MSEAHLPFADFQKALDDNLGSLARLAQSYPIGTLTYLDGMMRGLLHGRIRPSYLTSSLGLVLGSSLSDEYALNELRAAHARIPGGTTT